MRRNEDEALSLAEDTSQKMLKALQSMRRMERIYMWWVQPIIHDKKMYSLNIPFTMKKMATQFWLEFVIKREDIGIHIFKIMHVDYF